VVIVFARDSLSSDTTSASVTFDGNALTPDHEHHTVAFDQYVSVLYLADPSPVGQSKAIQVTHPGKCSDVGAVAVDFSGVDTTSPEHAQAYDTKIGGNVSVDLSDQTGVVAVGGCILADSAVGDISVATGDELHEIDLGNFVVSAAFNRADTCDLAWTTTSNEAMCVVVGYHEAVGGAIAPTSVILGPLVGPMGGPI
jgi:hypothetical protein